jgi:hypothetical protein
MQSQSNSKLGPVFTSVNRFNLQRLVLTLDPLSKTMHLLIFPPWYVVFHSLHYHLVI